MTLVSTGQLAVSFRGLPASKQRPPDRIPLGLLLSRLGRHQTDLKRRPITTENYRLETPFVTHEKNPLRVQKNTCRTHSQIGPTLGKTAVISEQKFISPCLGRSGVHSVYNSLTFKHYNCLRL